MPVAITSFLHIYRFIIIKFNFEYNLYLHIMSKKVREIVIKLILKKL